MDNEMDITWPIPMKPAFRLILRLERIGSRKSSEEEGVSEESTTRSFGCPCLEQEEQHGYSNVAGFD